MKTIKDLYEVYLRGDSLTDNDLVRLLNHFTKTYEMLSQLGDRFVFAAREAYQCMHSLEGFYHARKLDKE